MSIKDFFKKATDKINEKINLLSAKLKNDDVKIDGNNVDVIVLGKDENTKFLTKEEIEGYLKGLDNKMDTS